MHSRLSAERPPARPSMNAAPRNTTSSCARQPYRGAAAVGSLPPNKKRGHEDDVIDGLAKASPDAGLLLSGESVNQFLAGRRFINDKVCHGEHKCRRGSKGLALLWASALLWAGRAWVLESAPVHWNKPGP